MPGVDDGDDRLDVDDMLVGKLAEGIGPGRIPTRAILVVETVGDDGAGLQYLLSKDTPTWHAIGMVRSTLMRLEAADFEGWETIGGHDDD